ncbi:MAG: hypothetical protein Q4F83_08600 [Eubacteriales bacterium]|nr:hypothetical protein [Eubacteriales bacterium]
MSDKQKKTLIMAIALGQLVIAVAIMIIGVMNKNMTNLNSNILMSGSLFLYWLLMDVADAVFRHKLDGITPERRAAYYQYILLDFVGLAGIAVFLFGLGGGNSYSIIGAAIYAFTMKPKKDSQDVFYGVVKQDEEEGGQTEEKEEWVTAATRKTESEVNAETSEETVSTENETVIEDKE